MVAAKAHFKRNIQSFVPKQLRAKLRHQRRDMFNAPSEEEARGARSLYSKSFWEDILQAMNCLKNGFDEASVVYGLGVHQKSRCVPLIL